MEQFNTHFVVFDPGGHNFTLNSIRKSSLEPLIKILLLFDQTPAGTQRWINVESTLRIVDNGYQPYINHISTIDEDGWCFNVNQRWINVEYRWQRLSTIYQR